MLRKYSSTQYYLNTQKFTYPDFLSDYNLKLTNLDWILEQLDKPKVVSSGQELSVLGETGGVDICDVTLRWPDPLTRLP